MLLCCCFLYPSLPAVSSDRGAWDFPSMIQCSGLVDSHRTWPLWHGRGGDITSLSSISGIFQWLGDWCEGRYSLKRTCHYALNGQRGGPFYYRLLFWLCFHIILTFFFFFLIALQLGCHSSLILKAHLVVLAAETLSFACNSWCQSLSMLMVLLMSPNEDISEENPKYLQTQATFLWNLL